MYASPDIVRMIKSRKKRWAGHVARIEEVGNICKVFSGRPEGRDHSEDLGIDGKIILEWILGK